MNFHVLTLFPEMIEQGVNTSITGRAINNGLLSINAVNIRDYAFNKHNSVDDYPYGGGAGMLMQAEPVYLAYEAVKEQIDTSTPAGKLLFTLMSAVAQFERDVIAERTKEGLDAARARGHIGGRPRTNAQKVKQAVKLYHTKQYTVREIEELTGVKKATLYRSLHSL
mgnify:CR=1 FL=1